jgi:Glycosyl transferase family 2
MEPMISVVVPVYNERENLPALLNRLIPVLGRIAGESFEVVLVDDGSSDGSADILDSLSLSHENLRVIHLSRNFGHQVALQAGLDEAAGRPSSSWMPTCRIPRKCWSDSSKTGGRDTRWSMQCGRRFVNVRSTSSEIVRDPSRRRRVTSDEIGAELTARQHS